MHKLITVIFVAGTALSFALPSHCQGTAADYKRADNLPGQLRRAWSDGFSQLHWLSDGEHLWFREPGAYVVVEAGTGKTSRALNDEQVLQALAGEHPGVKRLELLNLARSKAGWRFRTRGAARVFDWNDKTGTLKSRPLTAAPEWRLEPDPQRRRSGRNGPRCDLLFLNSTKGKVTIHWVDSSNTRKQYAECAPGATFRISTFGNHAWTALSADGKVIDHWVADGKHRWVEIKKGKRKKKQEGRRNNAGRGASPDGRFFVRFDSHDLHLVERAGGKRHLLSDSGNEKDGFGGRIHWSPDSKYALVFRTKRGDGRRISFVESSPRDRLQPKLHTFGYTKPGDAIDQPRPWIIDTSKKKAVEVDNRLFPTPYAINRIRWSPDSRKVSFLYNERGHARLAVIEIDAATRSVRALVDERSKTFIDYAGKFFMRFVAGQSQLIWMSERSGWNHLYRINRRTGRVMNAVTSGDWVVRSVDRVDEKENTVYFWAGGIREGEDPYHLHYCRVSLDGRNFKILTEGDGTHSVTFSPGRRYFVDSWSRVDQPPQRVLRRTSDGKLLCTLGEASTEKLEKAGWQRPERFVAKGRDGQTDIWGILFRPSNFDPRKKYPVIEAIYAGPHSAHVPKSFQPFHGPQRIAELGFLVVKIDGMGTSHRSKAFHDVCWKNLKDAGFPDRIAWMKALAGKEPAMDLSRVGIYGVSAGGQNAMGAVLFHNDFYKAAVADCGCHDNRMDKIWWNELWMSYPVGPHYAASSNVDQAHRLKGDLLLMLGENDRNVDPASTMQVVDALIKADKDFDLVIVPGAGHGTIGSKYGRRRMYDFFVRSLHQKEPRL